MAPSTPVTPARTTEVTKIVGRCGPVTIRTDLYGYVPLARYEREKRAAAQRATMLDWTRPLPKIRIDPWERDCYYDR